MSHLSPERLGPGVELTDSELGHLAECAPCRVEARLMTRYLGPIGDTVGMAEAVASLAETRSQLSQSLLHQPTPEWWTGGFGTLEKRGGLHWWRQRSAHVPPGAAERAAAVRSSGAPVVPWEVDGDDLLSEWREGTTLDRWLAVPGQGDDRLAVNRLLEDIAAALAQLHRAGVAHGGVRPSRVLVGERTRAVLLFAGLEPRSIDDDVAAFRELTRTWLNMELSPHLDQALLALRVGRAALQRSTAGQLDPGAQVGAYTVESVLDRGAMAAVYVVRHRMLGTTHALKVLTRHSPALEKRLLREGKLQARLQHPNIVPVTDVLDARGARGLLMPLVRGPNLRAAIRHHRPSPKEALALFAGVVAGVRYAHEHGVVHRDLKPANVLLEPLDGGVVPRVVDFGLAKALHPEIGDTVTRRGVALGTPAYAAPEQLEDASTVDHRADLWALGCIAIELFTGEMPRLFEGHPIPHLAGAPDEMVAVVRGLLVHAPDGRMALDEVAAALEGLGAASPCTGPFADAVRASEKDEPAR